MTDFPYPRALQAFPKLRQSTLSSFDNCALGSSFEAMYRQGWSTSYQARGTIFHRFAGACLKQMQALHEPQIPVDAALGILRDVLRQEDADRVCPTCGSVDIRDGISPSGMRRCADGHTFETELVNVPLKEVKDLYWCAIKWAKDNQWDVDLLVGTEERLEAELRYPDRLAGGTVPRVLTGQIDALMWDSPVSLAVLDWKDTWGMPGPQDVSFKGYFQQRFYAWLIFSRFPKVQRVVLREFYVRYSEPREATVDRSMVPEIEAELAALAERFDRAYEERAFTPTPGKHCNYCLRPTACPIPVFGRDDGRVTTPERAQEVARQLIVAEKIVKDARSNLRAYADLHGPVPVKDAKGKRAFGYVPVERTSRPTQEELEAAIRDAGGAAGVSMEALYKKTKGTKFQAHVPADVDESAGNEEIERQLEESILASQARLEQPKEAA